MSVVEDIFAEYHSSPDYLMGQTADPELQATFAALENLGIKKDCTLNTDGTISVKADIDLKNRKLTELPDLSRIILDGNFIVSDNQLTSPKGSPRAVTGKADYSKNRMTTLEGSPQTIRSTFVISENKLTSLKGGPAECLSLIANMNQLENLDYAPKVRNHFSVINNNLKTMEGSSCGHAGAIECDDNPLYSLHGIPRQFKKLSCDYGVFDSWDEIPEEYRFSPKNLKDVCTVTGMSGQTEQITTHIRKKGFNPCR